MTLWASVQAPHDTRSIVAQVLGLDPAQVRVRTATVGGGFGGKIPTYPEHVVIAWLARHLGRRGPLGGDADREHGRDDARPRAGAAG